MTMGGVSDSEVNALTVVPYGSAAASRVVTTATGVQTPAMTSRNVLGQVAAVPRSRRPSRGVGNPADGAVARRGEESARAAGQRVVLAEERGVGARPGEGGHLGAGGPEADGEQRGPARRRWRLTTRRAGSTSSRPVAARPRRRGVGEHLLGGLAPGRGAR